MKTTKKYLSLLLIVLFSSCLTYGLEELPVYEEADVTNFKFEYRWADKQGTSDVLRVKPLNVGLTIDKEKQEIRCRITVPSVDNQGFTESERAKVSLDNIAGFSSISTAATIRPIGNAPVLGKPGDFSQSDMKYEVVAADQKTKKVWTLIIESFDK